MAIALVQRFGGIYMSGSSNSSSKNTGIRGAGVLRLYEMSHNEELS